VQRQVLTRMVGHGEADFLGRSSDLDRSNGNGVRVYETATGKMRTCGSADFLDLKMTKPNYKPNTNLNSNPNANPNTKQTLILI